MQLHSMQRYSVNLSYAIRSSDPAGKKWAHSSTYRSIGKPVSTIFDKRLPIDPVPSIIAAIIALAFSLPSSDL